MMSTRWRRTMEVRGCRDGMWGVALATVWAVGLAPVAALAAEDQVGCQANPTGEPIGGGKGYSRILTGGDVTVRTADELAAALNKAKPGHVVWIPGDVEIDLTGRKDLPLRTEVTLASDRGRGDSQGAKLFTREKGSFEMFRTAGHNVRVTGLRAEGSISSRERSPYYLTFILTTHHGLEVDNCEYYNWNYCGVAGRRGASGLYVHHCDIHHCQRSGLGYGVSLSQCDARIIANRFDYCRHHIASSGNPGCGYEAAYNLVLPNANGHYFDMHGGRDRGDGTDMAGEWLHIHHNTFQGKHRAIVIRGVPAQGATVHHNRFAMPIKHTVISGGNTRVFNNVVGPNATLEK